MKTILFSLSFLFAFAISVTNAQHLEKVWETSGLKTPESVLFDSNSDVIYVANINGDPTAKDGNGFISILNSDGKIKTLEWVKGLNAPKGMAVYKGKLYVSDIDELVEIDIKSGKVNNKYKASGAVFLNDVAACMNDMVFVSDTRTSRIYALKDDKIEVWFEGKPLEAPNGLMTEHGKLFVGDNNIYEIDMESKKVTTLVENAGGVDGLEKNNDGDFVFSNWPGKVFIHKNGKTIKLMDTTAEESNTADIDYDLKHDLVLVPTFFKNQIVAYKIVM
ncbi:MAG: hypothetical protein R2757_16730 [Draconibacterium sp.]